MFVTDPWVTEFNTLIYLYNYMNIMVYSKIESYIHTQILCSLCPNTGPEQQAKIPTLAITSVSRPKYFITSVSGIQPCQSAFISVVYIQEKVFAIIQDTKVYRS